MSLTIAIKDDGNMSMDFRSPLLNDNATVEGSVDYKGCPSVRSKSGCWKSAVYMIGAQVPERVAFYGVRTNLISYLTGPLRQSTATAAVNVNVLTGVAYLSPLVGGFMGDVFLGQFQTILVASILYVLALGSLCLSVELNATNYSNCRNGVDNVTCSPPVWHNVLFFSSLYVAILMQGGHRPCLQAFAVEQFDDEDPKEHKKKASFFNWWNFSMAIGTLFAHTVVNYIQENISWEIGFGITFIAMLFSLFAFILGTGSYRFRLSSEKISNPFVKIGSIVREAASNWRSVPQAVSIQDAAPENLHFKSFPSEVLERTLVLLDGSQDTKKSCNENIGGIKDAEAILKLIPFWLTCLGYAIVTAQIPTLFTKQGATMERHIGSSFQIPAASLQSLLMVSMIVLIPVYDVIFVPIARVICKNPVGITTLQRIGIGKLLSIISMVTAGFIESKRLATAAQYGLVDQPDAIVPMSIWWLVPQYMLVGSAQCFAYIGLQEFFFDQVPSKHKSVAMALYLSIFGIGDFLSSFLISMIEKATTGGGRDSWFSDNLNRAHLDYFYWLLAGISIGAFVAYLYVAKCYVHSRKVLS